MCSGVRVHSSIPCHTLLPYSLQTGTLGLKKFVVAAPDTLENTNDISALFVSIFSIRHADVEFSERIGKLLKDFKDRTRSTRDVVGVVVWVDDKESVWLGRLSFESSPVTL